MNEAVKVISKKTGAECTMEQTALVFVVMQKQR